MMMRELQWNPVTQKYDIEKLVKYAKPELLNQRGGPICAKCGGPTKSVLDGEAWCSRCGRYQ